MSAVGEVEESSEVDERETKPDGDDDNNDGGGDGDYTLNVQSCMKPRRLFVESGQTFLDS